MLFMPECSIILSLKNYGKMNGFTSNYIKMESDFDENIVNKLQEVEITGITENGICTGAFTDTNKSVELLTTLD
jgi:hypothetical protein